MNTNNNDEQIKNFLDKAFDGEANLSYGETVSLKTEDKPDTGRKPQAHMDEKNSSVNKAQEDSPSPYVTDTKTQDVTEKKAIEQKVSKPKPAKITMAKAQRKPKTATKRKKLVPLILLPIAGVLAILIFISVASNLIGNKRIQIGDREYRKSAYSIYLEDIELTTADKDALKKFTELGVISFSNCDLKGLDLNSIKCKKEISTVTIENCTGIDVFDFSEYKELRELNIVNSGLTLNNLKLGTDKKHDLGEMNISNNKDITDLSIVPSSEVSRLNISGTSITDLSPLGQFDNLYSLDASGIDLGANRKNINVICGLRNISNLTLDNCNTGNIDVPIRSKYIYKLSLANNNMSDLSVFADFKEMTELNVSGNPISEIPFLENCTDKLRRLDVSYTDIDESTINIISKCVELRNLKIDGVNGITDLSVIKDMPKIETIDAANCGLIGLDGIENHDSLDTVIVPHNEISSLKPLNGFTKKAICDLRYNSITTLSDLSQVGFDTLIISCNDISLVDETSNDIAILKNGIGSRNLVIDYSEDVLRSSLGSAIGGKNISYISVVNLPDDKQEEYNKLYSVWGTHYTSEEIDEYFDGRDYERSRYINLSNLED